MTETLERPQNTPELEDDFRLDLGKIDVTEHLPETSSFELRAAAPTAERPAAIYVAAPKKANEDLMTESLFAVQENGEAFWQISDSPESIGVVRGRADGSLRELGIGDNTSISGNFTIERGEEIYMIPNKLIEALKKDDRFNDKGINRVLNSKEGVKISFASAVTDASPDVPAQPISDKKAGFARRMRNRSDKPQGSTDENSNTGNEMTVSSQANETSVQPEGLKDTAYPNPEATANSEAAHQLRAQKAAELVREMNMAATMPLETTLAGVDVRAAESSAKGNKPAVTGNPLRGFAQRKQQQRQHGTASVKPPVGSRPISVTVNAESDETMTDEERQYLEDERRGFKITDNRKWSRVEMLGHEVGIHSDVSITVPVPEIKSGDSTTEMSSQAFLAEEMAKYAKQAELEATKDSVPATKLPFEVIDLNPDNDPAIESGLARLETLRQEMANLTANQQNRLFSVNGKKNREIIKLYNEQLVTLGQFVISDKLHSDVLTDSQKNVAVMKFLVNEQAALQVATTEEMQNTKASKFVEWMNIHGTTIDSTVDVRKVIQSIEKGAADDDKVRLAQRHLAEVYQKRVRTEQHERGKEAARVAAIGVVGMAATVFGINPSMVGDAANNMFYGARKK